MNFLKTFAGAIFIFFSSSFLALPGSEYDGDALLGFLGKDRGSNELKDLKAHYNAEMINDSHYLSKGGVELVLKNGVLSDINIYSKSAVYGSFTGALPKKLKFGMYSGDVKSLLGKPVMSYSSGYCEFETGNYILSCWFESGKLSQVGLSLKG